MRAARILTAFRAAGSERDRKRYAIKKSNDINDI